MMPPSPILKAVAWMSGSLVSLVALALAGRELGSTMSVAQIQFFRSAIGLVVVGAVVWRAGGWEIIRPRSFGVQVARNVAHFAGQLGWFYGLTQITFAQVVAIEFTAPVWTACFAVLLLGERMTRARTLAIVLGIGGVLVILRPGLGIVNMGALATLGGAVLFGLSHTLVKRLTRDNTALGILFYMTVLQLPMGFALALPHWTWPATPAAWGWTLAVGLSALTAHFCIAKALTHADATVVVPMDFLRVPLVTAIGLLVYGEAVDLWLMAGAGLILVGILQSLHAEHKR